MRSVDAMHFLGERRKGPEKWYLYHLRKREKKEMRFGLFLYSFKYAAAAFHWLTNSVWSRPKFRTHSILDALLLQTSSMACRLHSVMWTKKSISKVKSQFYQLFGSKKVKSLILSTLFNDGHNEKLTKSRLFIKCIVCELKSIICIFSWLVKVTADT